jgi:hypothetical protein
LKALYGYAAYSVIPNIDPDVPQITPFGFRFHNKHPSKKVGMAAEVLGR